MQQKTTPPHAVDEPEKSVTGAYRHVSQARLPTRWGMFTLHAFANDSGAEHIALTVGDLTATDPVLGRIHSECLTGDALFSLRCDCGAQLQYALQRLAEAGCGVLFYLRQEGRGIGLINKVRAYHLQDAGADTVEANLHLGFAADLRRYDAVADMCRHFGITDLALMTNNPAKVEAVEKLGIHVSRRVPIQMPANLHNRHYLQTKADKMRHWLIPDDQMKSRESGAD